MKTINIDKHELKQFVNFNSTILKNFKELEERRGFILAQKYIVKLYLMNFVEDYNRVIYINWSYLDSNLEIKYL